MDFHRCPGSYNGRWLSLQGSRPRPTSKNNHSVRLMLKKTGELLDLRVHDALKIEGHLGGESLPTGPEGRKRPS
jgi:hypothetical protein